MEWKTILNTPLKRTRHKLAKQLGYKFPKFLTNIGEHTLSYPYIYSTYSPWFEEWFQKIYKTSQHRTLVTEDRCYILYQFGNYCLNLEGDYAECGVYRGGTARLIADILARSDKRLHLFDTFEGMPESANEDPSSHRRGDFDDTSLAGVKRYVDFPFVDFHPGFIPHTFEAIVDNTFCFAHIDVDLYSSVKDCCDFFYNNMVSGGVMIFDDYGFSQYKEAARQAVDEFFADKPEVPVTLHTGQCLVIKL